MGSRSALPLVLAVLAVFCVVSPSLALPSGLQCPPPTSYPKDMLDNLWAASAGYLGTTNVTGYVLVNTGNYNFQQAAVFGGIFVQYYLRSLGTYVAEYYIADGPVLVRVLNITFTLLNSDKLSLYNEHCQQSNPVELVPEYVQSTELSPRFFVGAYYQKYTPLSPATYGDVQRFEYFKWDTAYRRSSNCLMSYTSWELSSMQCFEYVKLSNSPSIRAGAPAAAGIDSALWDADLDSKHPPTTPADVNEDPHWFLRGKEVRDIEDYVETFDAGKFRMPVSMLASPAHRAHVDVFANPDGIY